MMAYDIAAVVIASRTLLRAGHYPGGVPSGGGPSGRTQRRGNPERGELREGSRRGTQAGGDTQGCGNPEGELRGGTQEMEPREEGGNQGGGTELASFLQHLRRMLVTLC